MDRYRVGKIKDMKFKISEFSVGKTSIYYNGTTPIIVMDDSKEYYFKSLKEAKSKLSFTLRKNKNYIPAPNESLDNFELDILTGI